MWERLLEASSTLDSLKQTTPSDRSGVSGNQGTWEFDKPNNPQPWKDKSIWGNLNGQSRGMQGELDTQGKDKPVMFPSHNEKTGTYTPSEYTRMYTIKESANGSQTGISAGKHKQNGATPTDQGNKRVPHGDTNFGGSCNCPRKTKKSLTEAQLYGSAMALLASHILMDNSGKK